MQSKEVIKSPQQPANLTTWTWPELKAASTTLMHIMQHMFLTTTEHGGFPDSSVALFSEPVYYFKRLS